MHYTDEPDDGFARAVGARDLADLRAKIRQDLEAEAVYNNELEFEELILGELCLITECQIPEILIEDELNRMLISMQRQLSEKGQLVDDYLRMQGKTIPLLRLEWRPQAEKNVRMELGLSKIAEVEGITISDEELVGEIGKIVDPRVRAQFQHEEARRHLRHALRQTKVLNFLKTIVLQED